ncbi:SUKH-4 family immunity protein [Streptomyces sp. NPDC046805]|uniref:SUKH-4 family immunity protein n=1 Tax=Streptomyces sp. NPDC046805 TaxID=3155134 RepID=UPI0033CEC602
MSEELDDVLADPVRLLTADRAAVRDHIAAAQGAESVGREVFLQAEAIFGGADTTPAEFASWLHFAAKATGHEEYAERIAKAEPGMPWRTVWAWWRPANWFMAHPSLNGDYYQVQRRLYEGRELVEVTDQRGPLRLDAQTGRRVTVQDEGALAEASWPTEALAAHELHNWELTAPESWADALAFAAEGSRTRHLVEDAHGMAVLETDAAVLRDWPRGGGIDPTSSEEPPPGGLEPARRRPTGPLTAARVDDAFGQRHVVRLPENALPEGLEHPGSRGHLRDIGLPSWWACHGGEYETHSVEAMRPPADGAVSADGLPSGVAAADLIAFGMCDYGELYLHRRDGSVYIWSRLGGRTDQTLVPLAPDLDVFTRVLEAVDRYRNACWHSYPVEGDQETVAQVFLDELDELAPGLLDPATPGGEVWSWLYAGITELGVDGF